MRMIVEAFKETLELGLSKPEQVVVSISLFYLPKKLCSNRRIRCSILFVQKY